MVFNIGMVMIVVAVISFTIILSQFGNYSSSLAGDLFLPTVAVFAIGGIMILISHIVEWNAKQRAVSKKP
jgi:hypothetical protein